TRVASLVPPVYDLDLEAINQREKAVAAGFAAARKEPGNKAKAFADFLGIKLSRPTLSLLRRDGLSPRLEQLVKGLILLSMERGVVPDGDKVKWEKGVGITLRRLPQGSERLLSNPNSLVPRAEVRIFLRRQARNLVGNNQGLLVEALAEVAGAMVQGNVAFNPAETEARREEARGQVPPVVSEIRKGEMILREGERIGAEDMPKLKALIAVVKEENKLWINLGFGLLVFLILGTSYIFASRNVKKFPTALGDHLFLAVILVGTILWVKISVAVSDGLAHSLPAIPASSYYYAIPFAAGAMLVRFLINSETAVIFTLIVSLLAGMVFENNVLFSIYSLVGSLVAAHAVGQCEQRSDLIKAGLVVGAINMAMVVLFTLVTNPALTVESGFNVLLGFLGGVLAGVIVTGVAPLIEILFGYASNIKLLELANMDRPLLKRLIFEAPGTYHHSIITGTMAEAAARAIGANPLLARVSCYYHDIGKCRKPGYFVENQQGPKGKHDRLSPHMSSLILISHVKDGIEMAREHRLGKRIIDIIPQHHGTRLIPYFYHKARQEAERRGETVNENEFRYPGPKPQTREAGLVMLADAAEAACRTLDDPSPARISGLVRKIINEIFTDGQLEECELTLKDLHAIDNSFTHTLTGIFHQRIKYPDDHEIKELEGISYGSSGNQLPEKDKAELGPIAKGGPGGTKKARLPR
ncbi:MAG: HDIG domain-containing metalloprotein, partial [Thermodesulfobacteriota bacterium]